MFQQAMTKLRRAIADSLWGPLIVDAYTRFAPGKSARYDRETAEVLRRVLRHDSCAVDVGAHRGTILRHIVALAPRGTHHAFEPVPKYARLLEKRFPAAHVHQMALSDQAGQSSFCHVTDDPGLSGLRRRSFIEASASTENITVEVRTLDSVLPEDFCPTLVKVDVEGFELPLLRGARRVLTRHRPYLVFESGMSAMECVPDFSPAVLFSLLTEYGYAVSLMRRWLDGAAALSESEFDELLRSGSEYNFFAYRAP